MLCPLAQANGSLLLATTAAEVQQLESRAAMLHQQGIPGVVLLSPRELKMHEPALHLPTGSTALLTRSDAQLVSGIAVNLGRVMCLMAGCMGMWQLCLQGCHNNSPISATTWCAPITSSPDLIISKVHYMTCCCCMHTCDELPVLNIMVLWQHTLLCTLAAVCRTASARHSPC